VIGAPGLDLLQSADAAIARRPDLIV